MLFLTLNRVKSLNTEIQNLSPVSCCCQQVCDILNMSCLQCRHAIRWGAMRACLHCRMMRLHTHSLTCHVGRIQLSDPDQVSQWISVQIHLANRMTLGVSNVSRIHFGFKFIVNPDPITEYARICHGGFPLPSLRFSSSWLIFSNGRSSLTAEAFLWLR